MSSRFVSGGTIDSTGEVVESGAQATQGQNEQNLKSKEWETVQRELDAERKRREEHRAQAAEGGEKSLYDILQENKAAKQAAFEEQNKLRNQFRALDDDEVGFLDEVREKQRLEEERVRKETEEGLRVFRERQKTGPAPDVDNAGAAADEDEPQAWGVGKKRKRAKDKELKGVRRRVSEDNAGNETVEKSKAEGPEQSAQRKTAPDEKAKTIPAPASTAKKVSSALVGYGSDSSDDD
ncbi:PSME3-interacting protein [Paramyrothecium foliicola]|nr:PSME3-interacting protein [Paramyrothecium foliicola]